MNMFAALLLQSSARTGDKAQGFGARPRTASQRKAEMGDAKVAETAKATNAFSKRPVARTMWRVLFIFPSAQADEVS
jgi:hypothetical protein